MSVAEIESRFTAITPKWQAPLLREFAVFHLDVNPAHDP
jgi:hypothetical protein